MNINEILKKVIQQLLQENFQPLNLQKRQIGNKNLLANLVIQYKNTFPSNCQTYILQYEAMTPQQSNIMGDIAECVSSGCQSVINYVYRMSFEKVTYKDANFTPEDILLEFLGSRAFAKTKETPVVFGLPRAVGSFLNDRYIKKKYPPEFTGKDISLHIKKCAYNFALKYLDYYFGIVRDSETQEITKRNVPDTPLRSDLTLSTNGDSVSHNDAFKDGYNNILQTILNDKSIKFSNQGEKRNAFNRKIFKTFVDICGSGVSPELLNDMADSSEKQQKMVIYREIERRIGATKKQIQNAFSEIQNKLRTSKYMNYDWNIKLNIPQPQPKQATKRIPKPQSKQVTNSIPNPQPTKTQKVLKPAQPKSNKKIDNPNYNSWNYTISESNNRIKNKQNMKKVLVTESALKSLIIRALNESIFENEEELSGPLGIIKKWAFAVRNGANPIHCREFGDFYMLLHEHPYCENAVKMGFARESKNQSNVGGNTTLKIDKMFSSKPKIAGDVINDFFTGKNCVVTDVHTKNGETVVTKPDSFVGDNVTDCAKAALNGSLSDFFNVLCRQLRTYGAHYCRRHYGEFVIQWGVGGQQIGGEKSSAFEDEEGNDMEAFDELGNKINMSDEANRDAYSGKTKEQSDAEFDKGAEMTSNGDDMFFKKMIKLVGKIIDDNAIGLGPQEKAILQCVVDIAKTGVSHERLNQMEGLSDTQKRMVIYDEAAERLGIPVENLKRSISSAIGKARQSKYAKMLEEQKKLKEQLIKTVMNEVIARYAKK